VVYAEFRDLSSQTVKVKISVEKVVLIDGYHKGIFIAVDAVESRDALRRIVSVWM